MAQIRIFSPHFPWPHREAAWQVIANQGLALVDLGHDVELVSWKSSPRDVQRALKRATLPQNLTVTLMSEGKVISGRAPQWSSMEFSTDSQIWASRFKRVLKSFFLGLTPPELQYYDPSLDLRSSFKEVDLEIYHYSFAFAWLKNKRKTAKKTIVHFHNIESDLFVLRASQSKGFERAIHQRSAKLLRQHEIKLSSLVDEIWQHSQADLDEYQRRAPEISQKVVSPSIRPELHKSRSQNFAAASKEPSLKLGFIGGLDFEPNYLSLEWILKELAPLLKAQNFAGEVSQVGNHIERVAEAAADFDFVKLNGFVENVEEWWRSLSFLLVPDVTSAGVRMKILEAVGSGVPVIANAQALERLPAGLRGNKLLIELNTAKEWADFIVGQKPQDYRSQFSAQPLDASLSGKQIYSFISFATQT